MNSKILVVAFAGLSLLAAAQSSGPQEKPAQEQKSAAQPDQAAQQKGVIHRDLATRNAAAEKKDGKTTAMDDWHQTAKSTGSSNAAVADVNGDGKADLTQTAAPSPKVVDVKAGDLNGDGRPDLNSKNSGHATEQNAIVTSESNVKSPRDIATGQASGKRQHKPVTIVKEVDKASPKVAPSK
jgi:hypothetical protein